MIISNTPKVSIGMPVYNGEKYIEEAISCVLRQSYRNIELIISDNASTDRTSSICQSFASQDSRICYIRQNKNLGAPANYNIVREKSRGSYFKWASANDYLDLNFIESCLSFMDIYNDVVLVYGKTILIDDNGYIIKEYQEPFELKQDDLSERFIELLNAIRLNNVFNGLIRSDILSKCRPLGLYLSSDYPLMAELALHGKFHEASETRFYRRMGLETTTTAKPIEEIQEFHHPGGNLWSSLIAWRLDLGLLQAVERVPMSLRQKLRLYAHVCKMMRWNRRKLFVELFRSFRIKSFNI